MLYDMKVHLPQIVDEILKSYAAGELDKLYRQKTLVCKIMNDTDLLGKMKLIDEEKDKQRKQTIMGVKTNSNFEFEDNRDKT